MAQAISSNKIQGDHLITLMSTSCLVASIYLPLPPSKINQDHRTNLLRQGKASLAASIGSYSEVRIVDCRDDTFVLETLHFRRGCVMELRSKYNPSEVDCASAFSVTGRKLPQEKL